MNSVDIVRSAFPINKVASFFFYRKKETLVPLFKFQLVDYKNTWSIKFVIAVFLFTTFWSKAVLFLFLRMPNSRLIAEFSDSKVLYFSKKQLLLIGVRRVTVVNVDSRNDQPTNG